MYLFFCDGYKLFKFMELPFSSYIFLYTLVISTQSGYDMDALYVLVELVRELNHQF